MFNFDHCKYPGTERSSSKISRTCASLIDRDLDPAALRHDERLALIKLKDHQRNHAAGRHLLERHTHIIQRPDFMIIDTRNPVSCLEAQPIRRTVLHHAFNRQSLSIDPCAAAAFTLIVIRENKPKSLLREIAP
jgi:hypothetical protein